MEESMNSIERGYAAINLKAADRVPADPLNIYILAYYGGISIREFMTEPVKMVEATERAREKIGKGDKVCLYGNVPSSLLVHGTVNDVKKYCKKLIEDCADGGGFILSTECETPWDAKPENVKAIIDSAKEYGKYK